MKRLFLVVVCTMVCTSVQMSNARGVYEYVKTNYGTGDVKLVFENTASDIYVDPAEPIAVRRCAKDLAEDIKRVTGILPAIKNTATGLSAHAIIVGTIDNSTLIKSLVESGKLNVSSIKGKWEAFQIQTIANPLSGIDVGLIITGSDKRGTVYGMYDVSEHIGVSPWYWFADVAPQTQTNLVVTSGTNIVQSPSVKYRAIFINDEDWGIQQWSYRTYATADGGNGLGPTTYRRVFELILRMKANHIWPAMHRDRTPFNYYPANKLVADSFGIIMGSSHHEPLLRNVATNNEWAKEGVGEFNYQTNATNVYKFLEKRVIENGKYENIYTMGKRGAEDQAMPEGGTTAEKVTILEKLFADQRKILSEHVNPDPTKVPQVFYPYKEVLDLYYAGLKVPDDITIGWVDDNQGYIRSLPDAKERLRSGGSGVYYHLSYWGWQDTYLWLTSIPPSLVWAEMNKAWDYQARKVWVVNVGDIKPAEISTELFLDMAWNVTAYNNENIKKRMTLILERDFGAGVAPEIADIMETYYQLNFSRKPELMDSTLIPIPFSFDEYGDEGQKRIDAYVALEKRATAVYNGLPADLKDAFYEMVLYQVRCSMLQNQKIIYAMKSRAYAKQNRASAASYGTLATKAYNSIGVETSYYNNTVANGKWKNMMSSTPMSYGSALKAPSVSTFAGSGAANLNVRCQGGSATTLSSLSGYNRDSTFIDLYSTGAGTVTWTAKSSENWIQLSKSSGSFSGDTRVWVSIDWATAPSGTAVSGTVTFTGANATRSVTVPLFNPSSPARDKVSGFVESNGYISMEAEHFARSTSRQSADWKVVGGLGRSGDGVMVLPTTLTPITTASLLQSSSPVMEYDFYAFSNVAGKVQVYGLPNQSVDKGDVIRYAVAIDNGTPAIVNIGAATGSGQWTTNVNNGSAVGSTNVNITSGQHVLKVWMVDPGLVLDKIVINCGGLKTSYFGPPESYNNLLAVSNYSVVQTVHSQFQPYFTRQGKTLVFSNPSFIKCKIRVFNALGKVVINRDLQAVSSLTLPSASFRNGIYYYQLSWDGGRKNGTFSLLH